MLDEVRIHAASVADSARFVHIQPDGIRSYAEQLPLEVLSAPQLDPQTHYVVESEPELTLAYIVTLDAINFGSGYFPHLAKRPDMSGYFTVAASLKDAWPLSPNDLCRLTPSDCARIFGQSLTNAPIGELMGLFAQALNDLGEYVTTRYHGSFTELVESAHQSAESLVHIVTAMPFYRDKGFYKRAQLTAADLATARVQHFHDLERLTIFADNLVPHVLRVDGILRYEPELLARINREELIPAGSREEQEIRACAVHAVELIKHQLGGQVTSMQLDYLLWNRGQAPAYKAQPRHRTRTVFY